jgi:hypothetical protein
MDMEEEKGASNGIRWLHCDDADWSTFLPKLLQLIVTTTTARNSPSRFRAGMGKLEDLSGWWKVDNALQL